VDPEKSEVAVHQKEPRIHYLVALGVPVYFKPIAAVDLRFLAYVKVGSS
jgi:hypothetical protein